MGGAAVVIALIAYVLLSHGDGESAASSLAFAESDYTAESAVVWAVGDGADGGPDAIALAETIPADIDRFLYLGDVYDEGTAEEYEANYAPVYGHLDAVTSPVVGNHEWPNVAEGFIPYGARRPAAKRHSSTPSSSRAGS